MNFHGSVLLVDDEAHIRTFIGLVLRQIGVTRLLQAANGEEALAVYERERPDLVLLDINMPAMDGITTLEKLKQANPACVVVMLTSVATRETVERALGLGAANYLRKDTPKNEIARALVATIDACFETNPPPRP